MREPERENGEMARRGRGALAGAGGSGTTGLRAQKSRLQRTGFFVYWRRRRDDSASPAPRPAGSLRSFRIAPGDAVKPSAGFEPLPDTCCANEKARAVALTGLLYWRRRRDDSARPAPRPAGSLRSFRIAPGDAVKPSIGFEPLPVTCRENKKSPGSSTVRAALLAEKEGFEPSIRG